MISRENAFLLAKENYEFLQQHSKDKLGLDDSGRFCLKENSPPILGLAKKVEAAQVKAEVWGHLIPEIKCLKAKKQFSIGDMQMMQTLYDEIQRFRESNPSFLNRLEPLLENLEINLEGIAERAHMELLLPLPPQSSPFSLRTNAFSLMKAFGAHLGQIPAFFYVAAGSVPIAYVLAKVYKEHGDTVNVSAAIANLKTLDPNLLEGAEILALLGVMMFSASKFVHAESPAKSRAWGAAMTASIVALCALRLVNDQISKRF